MSTSAARKGNGFESTLLSYLRAQLGPQVTRPRPGEPHDRGDFGGVPGWTLEAKCYADQLRAIREGLADLAVEQANAGTRYGAVIVKRRGIVDPARQLFVMELGQALPLVAASAEQWER